jgi:hypothetical protein
MILGISGKKQSGKSTSGNFILSVYMAYLNIADKVSINDKGEIVVSDLFKDKNYAGVFDITKPNDSNDYIINKVLETLNPHIKLYSFADTLKQDICIDILGLTYQQCYGSDEDKNSLTEITWEDKKLTAREAMEIIGTNIFRTLKNNVWIDATLNKIKKDKPKIALVVDCRFPNEVESIKGAGGKVIRLTRNLFNSDAAAEIALDKENYDWSNFDYICSNEDMSIYDQCMEIQKILQEVSSL